MPQQMWHGEDPPCSKAVAFEHKPTFLQPFKGNGDVTIHVYEKYSREEYKQLKNKQTNKTKVKSNFSDTFQEFLIRYTLINRDTKKISLQIIT